MAFFCGVKKKNEKDSAIERNVYESRGALSLSDFWSRTNGHNFLISGGSTERRNQILLSAISDYRRRYRGPIIVLNGSGEFENILVQVLRNVRPNPLGNTVVSTGAYRNYDLFYGMDNYSIREILISAARETTGNTSPVFGDYADAILTILQNRYTPDYHSMRAMSELSNQEIANFGLSCAVDRRHVDCISNGTEGSAFRRTLEDLGAAFRNIHSAEETGFNISRIDNSDTIYVIRTDSASQRLFNMEIAKELEYLRYTRGIDYFLVVNDVSLRKEDELLSVIGAAKSRERCGICYANVVSAAPGDESKKSLLDNSHSMVVLNSGTEDRKNQEEVLERFGHYDATKTVAGAVLPPGLFHFPGFAGKHVGGSNLNKLRVSVSDMERYEIAVRGDHGDRVSLYRSCVSLEREITAMQVPARRTGR